MHGWLDDNMCGMQNNRAAVFLFDLGRPKRLNFVYQELGGSSRAESSEGPSLLQLWNPCFRW